MKKSFRKCPICNREYDSNGRVCKQCRAEMKRNKQEAEWWQTHDTSEENALYREHIGRNGKVTPSTSQ